MSGLVDAGMDPGAAMAFLIAGGVSSIPAAIAVYALVRLPVFAAYLLLAFIGAVISGLLFSLVQRVEQLTWTAAGFAAYPALIARGGRLRREHLRSERAEAR